MNLQGIACPDCLSLGNPIMSSVCQKCGYRWERVNFNFIEDNNDDESTGDLSKRETQEDSTINLNNRAAASVSSNSWEIVAIVDPSLQRAEGPQPPANQEPMIFVLEKGVSLIGRASHKKQVLPEISLDYDDAISHRHAEIIYQEQENLLIRDIGSSNGTKLNGLNLPANKEIPLKNGDQLLLGHWTRLILRRR